MATKTGAPALRLREVRKSYGPVEILHGIDFEVRAGECRALVGENGAGKSTLLGVIAGKTADWSGSYELAGQPARFATVRAAQRAGVALIHQETTSLPTLTVAENVLAGRLPRRVGLLQRRQLRQQAAAALEVVGLRVDVDRPAGRLGPAELQLLDIARALLNKPSVLLLDEPTASLPADDRDRLFGVIQTLRQQGTAVVFISHHLTEVFELCQAVTVMRDGKVIAEVDTAASSPAEVANLMVGRELAAADRPPGNRDTSDEIRLRIEGLTDDVVLRNINLEVHRGEVLAVTGLLGAGQGELVGCVLGALRSRGTMTLDGRPWQPRSVPDAVRGGVGVLTEDRKVDGLVLDESVTTNLGLASTMRRRWGSYRRRTEAQAARELIAELGISPANPSRTVGALSGGNQQKVALGKWLREPHAVMVLHEPTRGVDVGAKAVLHQRIRTLAESGTAVLLVSSDLPEVVALADRAVVLRRGEVSATLAAGEIDEERLFLAAAAAEPVAGTVSS